MTRQELARRRWFRPLTALSATAALGAAVLAWLPRGLEAVRFRQSVTSAIAHPLAVATFLAIQWTALVRKLLGCSTSWRGRSLTPQ